jgi:hypothetical protein
VDVAEFNAPVVLGRTGHGGVTDRQARYEGVSVRLSWRWTTVGNVDKAVGAGRRLDRQRETSVVAQLRVVEVRSAL